MDSASYSNTVFEDIPLGEPVSVTRAVSLTEVEAMNLVSGDLDVFHTEPEGRPASAQAAAVTAAPSVQAVGAEAMISALLNRRLPGPGTRILRQDLRFEGAIRTGETVTVTVVAREKNAEDATVLFDCTLTRGGQTCVSGTVTVQAPRQRLRFEDLATPEIVLRHNDELARLLRRCHGLSPVSCAVVHPCDRDSLLGPLEAAHRGLIIPVLVGPEARIRAVAEAEGADLTGIRLVGTEHSHAAAEAAVALARSGEVESLMKGSLHTDELLSAVVSGKTGLRTARRLSHVFVLDVPAYPRPLMVTDAAINIAPTLEDKADIARNAIDLACVLGIETPRVAVLSAVETVTAKIPSTLDAAALCKMADRGQIKGGVLDGPLAFDNAISEEAAKTKNIVSPVAGRADILLVPDLEAGNMLAKQLQYLAGAESAGILLGARVPIALTSRADSVRARLASTAVMVLVAEAQRGQPGAALAAC